VPIAVLHVHLLRLRLQAVHDRLGHLVDELPLDAIARLGPPFLSLF
jgi:hypothetical protein